MDCTANGPIDLDKLYDAIEGVSEGKVRYLTADELGDKRLAAAWNRMLDSIQADRRHSLLEVNGLLGAVTSMYHAKDVIDAVGDMKTTLHYLAAGDEAARSGGATGGGRRDAARSDEELRTSQQQGLLELSQQLNEIRLSLVQGGLRLTDKETLEICLVDHLMWRWRVYNMILGYERIDLNGVGTHRDCRLGSWYYGADGQKFKGEELFASIEEPHDRLHGLARRAIAASREADDQEVRKSLLAMEECSELIVGKLKELIRRCKG